MSTVGFCAGYPEPTASAMETTQCQCVATIREGHKYPVGLGSPCTIRLPGSSLSRKLSAQLAPRTKGLGLIGIFTVPHEKAGKKAWLIHSWDTLQNRDQEPLHRASLSRTESTSCLWDIQWLGAAPVWILWEDESVKPKMKDIRFDIGARHMKAADEIVGSRDGDGMWFFSRLLPRNVGAAAHLTEDGFLQLWLKL